MEQLECLFQLIDIELQGKFSVELKSENGNSKGARTFLLCLLLYFQHLKMQLKARHRIGILINI